MLLFTGAVVQLHKKRDQPDFCAVVSGNVPLQNSWRNDVTGQRDFPCDNSDAQHPFKHTKCSSHIQGNRCQNVIGLFHASITMRYGTQSNIFPFNMKYMLHYVLKTFAADHKSCSKTFFRQIGIREWDPRAGRGTEECYPQ